MGGGETEEVWKGVKGVCKEKGVKEKVCAKHIGR